MCSYFGAGSPFDQATKGWVRTYPEGQLIFEAGALRLVRSHNAGADFDLFQGHSSTPAAAALIGIVALVVIAFSFRRFPFPENRAGKLALGLILGGTAGNLIDRLRLGYVIDFIAIGSWPGFNIGDSTIVAGTVVLAYAVFSWLRAKRPCCIRR